MRALLLLSVNFFFPYLYSADVDSYEVNDPGFTPIYDIILFNDIAGVINDVENGLNSQSEAFMESENNENIEDLLLEYQHYLDKAHKQRLNYLEKASGKNKVPLLRHEKYPKKKPVTKNNHGDFYKSFPNNIPSSFKLFPNLGSFLPSYMSNSQFSYGTSRPYLDKYSHIESQFARNNNQILDMSYNLQKPVGNKVVMPSCYCKANEIPCNCECKQCIRAIESMPNGFDSKQIDAITGPIPYIDSTFQKPLTKHLPMNINANDYKIRIKVDIKLPKIFELLTKFYENKSQGSKMMESNKIISKDASINLLSPYSRLPSPMELLKYNSFSGLSESVPMQRITIHKKKKLRTNSNKKHRKKSFNIHGINGDKNITDVLNTSNNITSSVMNNSSLNMYSTKIRNSYNDTFIKSSNLNNSSIGKLTPKIENNQSSEFIYLTLNISNNNENNTDDVTRLENSIETGEIKIKDNLTTSEINTRNKRQIKLNNHTLQIALAKRVGKNINETHDKKLEKILDDPSLLYWSENSTPLSNNTSNNINTLIINIEKRKTKFNMTKENMRNNHSIALEKAVFGEVDWDDIDTVAPVFMSFVGKYVRGVLTFCSNTICHSMKCAEKTCIHRKCEPTNRYNNNGHCLGTSTDSIAKMEPIMDLPSNVAFEIVDILKDKMNAKLFGKMTICIGLKCITFVASKKVVLKSKCTSKELTPTKECPFNRKY